MQKRRHIPFFFLLVLALSPLHGGLVVNNALFPVAEAGEQLVGSNLGGSPGSFSATASFGSINAQASILSNIQTNALDATINGSGTVAGVSAVPNAVNFGFSYSLLTIDFSITDGLYAYDFTGSFEADSSGSVPVTQAGLVGSLEKASGGGTNTVWGEADVSFLFLTPQSFSYNDLPEGSDGQLSGTQGRSGTIGVGDYTVVLSGAMSSVGDGTYSYTASFSLEEIPEDPVIPEPATLGLLSIPVLVLFLLLRRSPAMRRSPLSRQASS